MTTVNIALMFTAVLAAVLLFFAIPLNSIMIWLTVGSVVLVTGIEALKYFSPDMEYKWSENRKMFAVSICASIIAVNLSVLIFVKSLA